LGWTHRMGEINSRGIFVVSHLEKRLVVSEVKYVGGQTDTTSPVYVHFYTRTHRKSAPIILYITLK